MRPQFQYEASRLLESRDMLNIPYEAIRDIESQRPRSRQDSGEQIRTVDGFFIAAQRYVAISFILMFLLLLLAAILGCFLLLLSLLLYLLVILPTKMIRLPLQLILLYWFFVIIFSGYLGAFSMFLLFACRYIAFYFIYFTLEL